MKQILTELLETSKKELTKPFADTQRKLLVLFNFVYLVLCPAFVTFEKFSNGYFVPKYELGYIYFLVFVINLTSFIYNIRQLRSARKYSPYIVTNFLCIKSDWDIKLRYASVMSVMAMSILNMAGYGNPSNDSIFSDFALGHSLIILSAVLCGRKTATIWFVIVLLCLLYINLKIGYNYQYNYLTPKESHLYENALLKKETWALERQAILSKNGLNPPHLSRYTNVWIIFIFIAFLCAYFFNGITHDILNVIPRVTDNIAVAIHQAHEQEHEATKQKNEIEKNLMDLEQERLSAELSFLKSQINPHLLFNVFHSIYGLIEKTNARAAKLLYKLSQLLQYTLYETNERFVSLTDEITFTRNYIEIELSRTIHTKQINFEIVGPEKDYRIPPLILVTFIENAFKHGLNDSPEVGYVDVSIHILECENILLSKIRNNLTNELPSKQYTGGVGLLNARRRLDLIYGKSGYTLITQSKKNEYFVQLEIPLSI